MVGGIFLSILRRLMTQSPGNIMTMRGGTPLALAALIQRIRKSSTPVTATSSAMWVTRQLFISIPAVWS